MLNEVRELAASAIEEGVHVALAGAPPVVVAVADAAVQHVVGESPPASVPTDDEIAKQRAANIAAATHAAALAAGAPPSGAFALLDGKMVPLTGAPAVAHVAAQAPELVEVKSGKTGNTKIAEQVKADHAAIRAANPALFPRNPGQ